MTNHAPPLPGGRRLRGTGGRERGEGLSWAPAGALCGGGLTRSIVTQNCSSCQAATTCRCPGLPNSPPVPTTPSWRGPPRPGRWSRPRPGSGSPRSGSVIATALRGGRADPGGEGARDPSDHRNRAGTGRRLAPPAPRAQSHRVPPAVPGGERFAAGRRQGSAAPADRRDCDGLGLRRPCECDPDGSCRRGVLSARARVNSHRRRPPATSPLRISWIDSLPPAGVAIPASYGGASRAAGGAATDGGTFP